MTVIKDRFDSALSTQQQQQARKKKRYLIAALNI